MAMLVVNQKHVRWQRGSVVERTAQRGKASEYDQTGGIANFGWVAPGRVARGEQPHDRLGGYAYLRDVGVTCLLCLREARERRNVVAGRPFHAFRVEDEAEQSMAHGLQLVHVPFEDRTIPPAEGLLQALEALEAQLALGETVYIHCMAGIGRTGLVAALWRLAQGDAGDDAADEFVRYWLEFGEREEAILGPLPDTILERYGFRLQWWALLRLADMADAPVLRQHGGALQQAPEDAEQWLAEARRTVGPWVKARRAGKEGGAGER